MPVPAVSPLTSILAPFVGERFLYQPAATNSPTAWKERTPKFSFTLNTTTNVITVTGLTLREGMRVRLLSEGYATGTITSTGTPANGDTVTIGNKTYTFKTSLASSSEGDVLINGQSNSLLNLIRAINHSGTPGTDYNCAAAHTQVTAATSVTSNAFAITSILPGTAYQTLETSNVLSWGASALTGGIGTLPAPLLSGPWYYLRDVDVTAGTAKLVSTKTGLIGFATFTITGVASTDVITTTGAHGLSVGDRVYFPALTGGSGLTAASAFYYVQSTPTTTTLKVSATLGGSALDFTTDISAGTIQRTYVEDITDSGTGTHSIQESALPEGLTLDRVVGTVTGTPEEAGFYQVTIAATNPTGDSDDFIFPIAVRENDALLDTAIGLDFDWDTGRVSLVDGRSSTDSAKPLFAIKNGDQIIFAVKFKKSDVGIQPVVQYLTAAIKVEDEEDAIVLTTGGVTVKGRDDTARFYFVLDTTAQSTAVKAALDDIAMAGNDVAPSWMELRVGYIADPLNTGTGSMFYKASRSIPVSVERSLIAA